MSYDPKRPRKWNRESIEVNMTAACREQCDAALSRPPRRFATVSPNARRRLSRGARNPPPPSIRNSSYSTTRSVDTLPRHPDAAFAALEDKFRNRGTPPPAALARIALGTRGG